LLTSANVRNADGVAAAGALPGAPASRCALAMACADGGVMTAAAGVAAAEEAGRAGTVPAGALLAGGASGSVAQAASMQATTMGARLKFRANIERS
jgi:hypothetical protein